jgi:Putative prokaryotic signal transducing protein
MEASAIAGYLEAEGVPATFATSRGAPLAADIPVTGRQEIFVRAKDLEQARRLLERR